MRAFELNQRKAEVVKKIIAEINSEEALRHVEICVQENIAQEQPPCQYTAEELRERGRKAVNALRQGGGTPHEQVKRKIIPAE